MKGSEIKQNRPSLEPRRPRDELRSQEEKVKESKTPDGLIKELDDLMDDY